VGPGACRLTLVSPDEPICLYRKGDQSPVLRSFLEVLREFRDEAGLDG